MRVSVGVMVPDQHVALVRLDCQQILNRVPRNLQKHAAHGDLHPLNLRLASPLCELLKDCLQQAGTLHGIFWTERWDCEHAAAFAICCCTVATLCQ
jgi:hypothetical protein